MFGIPTFQVFVPVDFHRIRARYVQARVTVVVAAYLIHMYRGTHDTVEVYTLWQNSKSMMLSMKT